MNKVLAAASAAILSLCALSCNSPAIDINGEWTVVSVDGVSVPDSLGVAPTIAFDAAKGNYHARPGVNLVNGSYTLKGNELTFGEGAMTRMAGPEPLMVLEENIVSKMAAPVTLKLEDGILSLTNPEGAVVLELRK